MFARFTLAFLLSAACQCASAAGLECGTYEFPYCKGAAYQFDPSFRPQVGYGGFGGAKNCTVQRVPVIFIHGNADSALGWDSDVVAVPGHAKPAASVYDSFAAHGYKPCELFGLTYLSAKEQRRPHGNFHRPAKYTLIVRFIEAVKRYTGAQQVDIVAHSLGVSMSLAALTWRDAQSKEERAWPSVRRFVNIAGGIRGLGACDFAGPFNPMVPTCGSENLNNRWVFGFFQDNPFVLFGPNEWTAADGRLSLREAPARHPGVAFYTISAGAHDQVHCSTVHGFQDCASGPLFEAAPNVRAQLEIGAGATAAQVDMDFSDRSAFVKSGGDADGVGHFKARNQAGEILVRMLDSDCTGLDCRGGYSASPVEVPVDPAPGTAAQCSTVLRD